MQRSFDLLSNQSFAIILSIKALNILFIVLFTYIIITIKHTYNYKYEVKLPDL